MSLSVDISKKLKNFTLNIKFDTSDTTIGILGASGCGKSLTLKSIAGIITPDSGRIVLNGKVLFDSEQKINLPPQKRKIGYLFQNFALFPNMTVEKNIAAGILENKNKKKEKVKQMITTFCLGGLERQYPNQLSGGQQQRVALARIMASETDVLLLDEPFSALDYYLKEQLAEQLLEKIKEYKKDVILVTHDRDEVFRLCPSIVIMDEGHLICKGERKDIFQNPEYLIAARLTGCKNFSKAKKISDHEVYASDWNMNLHVEQRIPDELSYVGIRAHHLFAVADEKGNAKNLMEPDFVETMENPFEINIIIRNKNKNIIINDIKEGNITNNSINNSGNGSINNSKSYEIFENKIWWKLTKEQWYENFNQKIPKYISFPSQHILLLKE